MARTKVRNPPPVPGKATWVLGLVGLLPMVVGAVTALATDLVQIVDAARLYGLVILSFMGGSHWGFNVRHNRTPLLALSVLPALIGWAVWLSLDRVAESVALALAFVATQLLDEYQTEAGYLHEQYRSLRRLLTAVAVVSLLCMATAG